MATLASPVVRQNSIKPNLPLLRTPSLSSGCSLSSGYCLSPGYTLPSALPKSPLSANPFLKVEQDVKTPITPPNAYMDFLKALSPSISTPMTATSAHSNFSFTFSDKSGHLTPVSQPQSAQPQTASYRKEHFKGPDVTSVKSAPLVPPTPFVRPSLSRSSTSSGKTIRLKKLRIPQSPSSAGSESTSTSTPRSACLTEPVSSPRGDATPRSAVPRSPFSPTSWIVEGKTKYFNDPPQTGRPRSMSVKQVVTRTVTYTRTPLDPAPRGKRRKMEEWSFSPSFSSTYYEANEIMHGKIGGVRGKHARWRSFSFWFGIFPQGFPHPVPSTTTHACSGHI